MTQGAVSRQVASLEEFLGVALFQRTRHGMVLTPEGKAYARQVAMRLDALERDTLDVMAHESTGSGIRLATVPSFATQWLLPRLPGLLRRAPDLSVHIDTRTRPFLFAESEFDAALWAGTLQQMADWPGTRADLLLHEEVMPVASPALLTTRKRWRPDDLAALPLLQQSTRPLAWRRWFEAAGVQVTNALSGPRYELFSMLAMAASKGLGVALIPTMLIERELAAGELKIVVRQPMPPERAYYFVTPLDGKERAAVATLREWLIGEAKGQA